jgi:hypothetical protein
LSFFHPPSLTYNFFPFELVTYNKSMLLSFGISQRAMQVFELPSAAENMCCCLMCLLSCRRPFYTLKQFHFPYILKCISSY